jgi:hypothetical protein
MMMTPENAASTDLPCLESYDDDDQEEEQNICDNTDSDEESIDLEDLPILINDNDTEDDTVTALGSFFQSTALLPIEDEVQVVSDNALLCTHEHSSRCISFSNNACHAYDPDDVDDTSITMDDLTDLLQECSSPKKLKKASLKATHFSAPSFSIQESSFHFSDSQLSLDLHDFNDNCGSFSDSILDALPGDQDRLQLPCTSFKSKLLSSSQ